MTRHTAYRAAILALLAFAVAACRDLSTEPGESGTQWSVNQTATETRSGVTLVISYNSARDRFDGTVTNTTNSTVNDVRVEIHLSNGTELGPTPRIALAGQEVRRVTLDNTSGQSFTWYSVHVEVGSSSS
jgi:hypothetical protein